MMYIQAFRSDSLSSFAFCFVFKGTTLAKAEGWHIYAGRKHIRLQILVYYCCIILFNHLDCVPLLLPHRHFTHSCFRLSISCAHMPSFPLPLLLCLLSGSNVKLSHSLSVCKSTLSPVLDRFLLSHKISAPIWECLDSHLDFHDTVIA